MRLKYLKISQFKNLANITVNFAKDSWTTVVVGRNGTGKSNLLECLVIIFRDLDLGEQTSFAYTLEYVTERNNKEYLVNIECSDEKKTIVTISSDNEESQTYTLNKFQKAKSNFLPRYVFGYYSGPSNRLESHFQKHQDSFYRELLKGVTKPLRPLLYARHIHSQFVLMAFFHERDDRILSFLKRHLGIEGLDSILFVMREPPWNSKEGDERFWKSRGMVADFLDKLYNHSLAPIRQKQKVKLGFNRNKTVEHLYLYLHDEEALAELAKHYSSSQEFFKALESTYISQLIREVRIRVKVRKADGSLTFQELSEGEQQLLTVLGLLRFTKEDESLFLLDEPDTHLNPAWSMLYIDFLREIVGEDQNSHIIMTTHDPLVVANLSAPQVLILRREEDPDSETPRITIDTPEKDPFMMGYPAILTSDIFALRSIITPRLQKLLTEKRELQYKTDRTEEETKRLQELIIKLEEMDFSKVIRDPLYEPFIRAMTVAEQEKPELKNPVLSEEELLERQRIANEIFRELEEEEKREK